MSSCRKFIPTFSGSQPIRWDSIKSLQVHCLLAMSCEMAIKYYLSRVSLAGHRWATATTTTQLPNLCRSLFHRIQHHHQSRMSNATIVPNGYQHREWGTSGVVPAGNIRLLDDGGKKLAEIYLYIPESVCHYGQTDRQAGSRVEEATAINLY